MIEDETNFRSNFAHEIVGGLLDIEPRKWRKGRRMSFEEQNELASNLRKSWLPFNPFRTGVQKT